MSTEKLIRELTVCIYECADRIELALELNRKPDWQVLLEVAQHVEEDRPSLEFKECLRVAARRIANAKAFQAAQTEGGE